MIYCFDLDNTLCKTNGNDYENAEPLHERIKIVNELFNSSNTIIIDTARGSVGGRDHYDFTFKQLNKWGVKFNILRTGVKFFADKYIDDKGISDLEFFNGCR